MLYEYIKANYAPNEPILSDELQKYPYKSTSLRQELKSLTDKGLLRRYDRGIYYLPKMTIFNIEAVPSRNSIIEKKYLKQDNENIGYVSGLGLANQLGLTSQVASVVEIVTNKATKEYKELSIGNVTVIMRKPKITIDSTNYQVLQFLDLIKDINAFLEISKKEAKEKILLYIQKTGLLFSTIEKYLKYYPPIVYKNLYEMGFFINAYS